MSRFGIPLNTYCIHCLDALELSQAVQGMLFVGNNGNDDSSAKAIKEPLRICCRNMLKLSHERLLVCAIIRQSYGDVPYLFLSMYVSSFEHTHTHTPVVKTSSLARVGQARLVRVCKPGVHKSRCSRVLCFISHVSCQDGLCQSTSNAVTAPEGGINADRAPR